jgi:hypothetical protein
MGENVKNTVPKPQQVYKYGFKKLYESLSKPEKTEIKKQLVINDIPYNTFYGYINIKLNEPQDIPFQTLCMLCKIFKVSIFEISNFKITLV